VIEAWDGDGRIVGTMVAHPGAYLPSSWFTNAIRPELLVVDCATNGRGHPTVAMGGMGLASRRDVEVTQAASGGLEEYLGHIEIVARGPVGVISSVLHHASAEVGASIASSRGPFSVELCRTNGADGAVSACLRLGEAMLGADGHGGDAMIAAIVDTLGGRELGRGSLVAAETNLVEAWDVGTLAIDADGSRLEIVVCNEYMAAEMDGRRLSTYPDLIVTLSATDGMPTAAARMEEGDEIVVVTVPKDRIPLGAGVWDAVVYEDAERLTGREIASYALAGAPAR